METRFWQTLRMEVDMVGSISPATQVAAPRLGTASGSRDNALVDIFNTLTDETGRFSDAEKMAAYKRWGELGQKTDADRPYGFAGYSTEDLKLMEQVGKSSFIRKLNNLAEKQTKFGDELVRSGKSGSAGLQAQIEFFDSLSPLEKSTYPEDYRDTLVALKRTFQKLEERVAAGAFKWGTPIDQVQDAEAKAALLLIDRLQDPSADNRKRAREEAFALKVGGFGSIQDAVSLSSEAIELLARRS